MKIARDLPGGKSVSPVISIDAGLRLPLDGLRENDPSLKITSNAESLGSITWKSIPSSPPVAVFSQSEVTFSLSDAKDVQAGEPCNIYIAFNYSEPLVLFDAITVKLPSFSGAPNSHLQISGSSAINFTASWMPHTNELTLVNKAQFVKAGSDVRVLILDTAGIQMSIQFTNSK